MKIGKLFSPHAMSRCRKTQENLEENTRRPVGDKEERFLSHISSRSGNEVMANLWFASFNCKRQIKMIYKTKIMLRYIPYLYIDNYAMV